MDYEAITLTVANHVATVTLNRPPVNAQNRRLRDELIHAFDDLGDDAEVRAIVLTGAGKVFSAGADIKERGVIREAKGEFTRHNRVTREFFYAILECPRPVICAVNGPALGAGFSLVTVCDIVLAADNATFGMPEVDVGMAGGAKFMLRYFGQSKARMLLFTGERIPASELYRLGAIEACVPLPDLMPRAMAIAENIAGKSPLAVAGLKRSFQMAENLPLRDLYRLEQNITVELSKTEDSKEAQRAFLERRKPLFKGR
jgi:enoyl-CoA hydratase